MPQVEEVLLYMAAPGEGFPLPPCIPGGGEYQVHAGYQVRLAHLASSSLIAKALWAASMLHRGYTAKQWHLALQSTPQQPSSVLVCIPHIC